MVLTDQYMQKMETELTEVRQCVVKMESAMQKFLNNSRDTAKPSSQKKDGNEKKDSKDSKDNKSVGDQLVASLKKVRDQGNKIGDDIGKAAGNALSKAGDALVNYLKTGKLDLSGVVTSLKTDSKNIATKEVTSLLAGGLLKWLGVNDSKSKTKPGEKQENNSLANIQSGFSKFFDQLKKDFGQFLDDGKDFIGTATNFFKGKKSDGSDSDNPISQFLGGLTKGIGQFFEDGKSALSGLFGLFKSDKKDPAAEDSVFTRFFDGLTKAFGQFFEDGKTVLGQLFNFVSGGGKTGGVLKNDGQSGGILGFFGNIGSQIGSFLGVNGNSESNGTSSTGEAGNTMGKSTAEGMQQVAKEGKKSADDMANAMQGAMKRTEGVLTRFVETGKLSFKDLTKSILADIAQIMIKMAVSKLIGSIFGSFGGGAGGGAAVASAAGGYDIPSGENPVTQLHEKEMVLPSQYANVIRGLANNGGTAAAGGGININTSISVASDGSSNQQSDGGGSSQRQLADMINSQTKAIIAREMRQGGLIWNMRMGVA